MLNSAKDIERVAIEKKLKERAEQDYIMQLLTLRAMDIRGAIELMRSKTDTVELREELEMVEDILRGMGER